MSKATDNNTIKSQEQERTKANKAALIEAMQKSLGVVTSACKAVGVNRTTFYKYYNNDPDFARACDECSEIALDFAESQLHKQIQGGNPSSTIFYLKTKGKKRGYIEKQEIDHTSGGEPFAINIISYHDKPHADSTT